MQSTESAKNSKHMQFREEYVEYEVKSLSITSATYIGDYAIRIAFNDGHERLVDFKPFLMKTNHPTVLPYREESRFEDFTIQNGNLDWHDYELCFALSDLYDNTVSYPRS